MLNIGRKKTDPVLAVAREIKQQIQNEGTALVSSNESQQMLSFESLDPVQQAALGDKAEGLVQHYREMLLTRCDEDPQFALENFGIRDGNEFQKRDFERALDVSAESMAVVALASGAPSEYAKISTEARHNEAPGVRLMHIDTTGTDYRYGKPAMEAFDERELAAHIPYSATFAAFAARQDEAAEALFPTATVTGDQAGLDIRIERPTVYPESKTYHTNDGAITDFGRRSLIEAAVDAQILSDEFTRLVPVVKADGTSDEYFISDAQHATYYTAISGHDIPTRPLAVGKKVNLIGISNYSPLLGSVMDSTDAVDSRVTLDKVFLAFADDEAAVGFSTQFMPRNSFVKSVEGNYREMNLQFSTTGLRITADTVAVDGTVPAQLDAVVSNNWTVFLSVTLNGVLNTEFGTVQTQAFPIAVDRIEDENGNIVSHTSGGGQALAELLEGAAITGYELNARRTNSNLRTRGHIVNSDIEVERYTIPLGSPITYPSPVHATGREGDIRTAITTARFRNSNLAMTALLNYEDALRQVVGQGQLRDGEVPSIAGSGRWVVRPWFEEQVVDVSESIDSEKAHERAADVALTLVNAVRDMAYRAYRDSYYQAALNALTGGSAEKPTLLLVTDSVIERHLMVAGDTRTFGTAFDKYRVVSTLDRRLYGKIYFTFTRGNADPSDVLSFGTHAWMPELSDSLPISRNNATFRQAIVQPRNLHVPKLPILGVLTVKGLSKALSSKASRLMVGPDDISNPYLPGLD